MTHREDAKDAKGGRASRGVRYFRATGSAVLASTVMLS